MAMGHSILSLHYLVLPNSVLFRLGEGGQGGNVLFRLGEGGQGGNVLFRLGEGGKGGKHQHALPNVKVRM